MNIGILLDRHNVRDTANDKALLLTRQKEFPCGYFIFIYSCDTLNRISFFHILECNVCCSDVRKCSVGMRYLVFN